MFGDLHAFTLVNLDYLKGWGQSPAFFKSQKSLIQEQDIYRHLSGLTNNACITPHSFSIYEGEVGKIVYCRNRIFCSFAAYHWRLLVVVILPTIWRKTMVLEKIGEGRIIGPFLCPDFLKTTSWNRSPKTSNIWWVLEDCQTTKREPFWHRKQTSISLDYAFSSRMI